MFDSPLQPVPSSQLFLAAEKKSDKSESGRVWLLIRCNIMTCTSREARRLKPEHASENGHAHSLP